MEKINRTVVRNQAYRAAEFSVRERHNERKNESYHNGDIEPERFHLNVHFKKTDGTYSEMFERMKSDDTISTRGHKKDAKVFDELVFDVNTEYFESNGGYEYAKSFFEEAYRHAVEEVGGEKFILSAVMHADERNKALSEKLGRDVYHYHLHVVYVPVVDKEIRWTKRCKDPALVGTVKERIKQVSHSKKWAKFKDENGRWVNSYSLLQDRFFEHMKQAGFKNFERGEKGSTTEHLSVIEFKTKKEIERLAELKSQTKIKKKTIGEFEDIDSMASKNAFGKIVLTTDNWDKLSTLAKEGIRSRNIIKNLKDKVKSLLAKITGLEKKLEGFMGRGISDSMEYFKAKQHSPKRLKQAVAEILRQPPEVQEDLRSRGIGKSSGER